MTGTVVLDRLPFHPRLGRNVEHDPRSLNFPAVKAAKLQTVLWGHSAPVLDQGQVGSCTGNASAQLFNTDAWAAARAKVNGGKFVTEGTSGDKTLSALGLYHWATELDGYKGVYPPTDTGSSGLAVAKAGQKLGMVGSYQHAFGLDHLIAALQLHPVICGTEWTNGMFKPDKNGFVKPTGSVAGGHEYLCLGVDLTGKFLTFLNSWSDTWGQHGRFYITFDNYTKILAQQGDVTVPIPIAA